MGVLNEALLTTPPLLELLLLLLPPPLLSLVLCVPTVGAAPSPSAKCISESTPESIMKISFSTIALRGSALPVAMQGVRSACCC